MAGPVLADPLARKRLVAAPMVDQSELPFRLLCRSYGAEVCYTPMLHAALFVKDVSYRSANFSSCPSDRPLVVQFCANDPDVFAAAAMIVEPHCDAVDLNLGCPQGIAKKGHYGAFLQDDWDLITRMIQAASKSVAVPISCKIRIFPEQEKTIRYAQTLVAAGAKLLTVHGRTREMKGVCTGLADWEQIRAVKANVSVPVFGNGNIQFTSNVDQCFAQTGVDGVMAAEALLYNPAFFSSRHVPVTRLCREYLQFYEKYPTQVFHVRAHFFKILHHVLQLPENVHLRESMTKSKTIEHLKEIVGKVSDLYEVESEDQTLEMTTLPVPVHVSQPMFRIDRTILSPADVKRKRVVVEHENCPASSNKKAKADRCKKLQLCVKCVNPRGLTCSSQMCKSCCCSSSDSRQVCENHSRKSKKVNNNSIGHDV